jgi:hypothetical protein
MQLLPYLCAGILLKNDMKTMICLVASAIALSGVAQAQSKENKGKILVV